MAKAVPLLVLDLDGTVRKGRDELGRFVNGPEDVEVFPEARKLMAAWRENGGRIIGVTNQGGIALGIVPVEQVLAAVVETQKQTGHLFDHIGVCQHHPDAKDPLMARCWCRKPSPGLLVESACYVAKQTINEMYPPSEGLMVGDRPEDEECARLAGFDFMWAAEWRASA